MTHMAINNLSDAWVNKVYTDEVALTLANSYKGGLGSMNQSLAELIRDGQLSPDDLASVSEFAEAASWSRRSSERSWTMSGIAGMKRRRSLKPAGSSPETHLRDHGHRDGRGRRPNDRRARAQPSRVRDSRGEDAPRRPRSARQGHFRTPFRGETLLRHLAVQRTAPPTTGSPCRSPIEGHRGRLRPRRARVAIYELNGKKVGARWAPYAEARSAPTTMLQGENDSIYHIDGQKAEPSCRGTDAGTAKLTWKYPSSVLNGYGVAVGNYLAAVSAKPADSPASRSTSRIPKTDPRRGSGRWKTSSARSARRPTAS